MEIATMDRIRRSNKRSFPFANEEFASRDTLPEKDKIYN
jgi:hypothetical protein